MHPHPFPVIIAGTGMGGPCAPVLPCRDSAGLPQPALKRATLSLCCRPRRRVPGAVAAAIVHRDVAGLSGYLAHTSCTLGALEARAHLFALGDVPESASLSLPCPGVMFKICPAPSSFQTPPVISDNLSQGVGVAFLRIPGLCSSWPSPSILSCGGEAEVKNEVYFIDG